MEGYSRVRIGLVLATFAAACGGGDGTGEGDGNRAPQFSVQGIVRPEVPEGTEGVFFELIASDADGDDVSFALTDGADVSAFTLNGAELSFSMVPDFEDPQDANGDNVYELVATASDGNGGEATQQIEVIVLDGGNEAPMFTSDTRVFMEEGIGAAPERRTGYFPIASDPDGEAVRLSVSSELDGALLEIVNGELAFREAPNFEEPRDADGDNQYDVIIVGTDGAGLTAMLQIELTVTDVNDPPSMLAEEFGNIPENTVDQGYDLMPVDEDGGAPMIRITGGTDEDAFEIRDGVLFFLEAQDFENPGDSDADGFFEVTIRISDAQGQFNSRVFGISIANIDEGPEWPLPPIVNVLEGTSTVALSFNAVDPEGAPVSYGLAAGGDAGRFEFSSAPEVLRFSEAPDFEAPTDLDVNNLYTIDLLASDAGGNTSTVALTVRVLDISGPFASGQIISGQSIDDVSTADLDADGDADLIGLNRETGDIDVFVRTGPDVFDDPLSYSAGTNPADVAFDDLDGDGNLDVAVASEGGQITVFLGNGDGTLQSGTTIESNIGPESIAIADITGDGSPDLLTVGGSTQYYFVRNDGAGNFDVPSQDFLGGNPVAIVAADLNGDNRTDIAVASSNPGRVNVFLATPDFRFVDSDIYNAATTLTDLYIEDLDRDGVDDLIALAQDRVLVLEGRGDGSFEDFVRSDYSGSGGRTASIVDFDLDGELDMLVAHDVGSLPAVSILVGDGNFMFTARDPVSINALGLAVDDVNGDAVLDVLGAGGGIVAYAGSPGGRINGGVASTVFGDMTGMTLFDVDADGNLDVVTRQSNGISVGLGRGDGSFESGVVSDMFTPLHDPQFGFFDGDAVPDLAVGTVQGPQVMLGSGGAAFTPADRTTLALPVAGSSYTVVAQFNEDMLDDVCAVTDDNSSVFPGEGDGGFLPDLSDGSTVDSGFVIAADVNNDARLDLIGIDPEVTPRRVRVRLGDGDGTFGFSATYTLPGFRQANEVAAADMDGDGDTDLVVLTGQTDIRASGEYAILFNTGSGTFFNGSDGDAGGGTTTLELGDLTGDGFPDAITAGVSSPVQFLVNDGVGGFLMARDIPTGGTGRFARVGDVDNDGLDDLVVGGDSSILVLLGNGES